MPTYPYFLSLLPTSSAPVTGELPTIEAESLESARATLVDRFREKDTGPNWLHILVWNGLDGCRGFETIQIR